MELLAGQSKKCVIQQLHQVVLIGGMVWDVPAGLLVKEIWTMLNEQGEIKNIVNVETTILNYFFLFFSPE